MSRTTSRMIYNTCTSIPTKYIMNYYNIDIDSANIDVGNLKINSIDILQLIDKINKMDSIIEELKFNYNKLNKDYDKLNKDYNLLKLHMDLSPPGIYNEKGGELYTESEKHFKSLNSK